MFTGIIETIGTIEAIEKKGLNLDLTIRSAISASLKIDQSVAHNGVCLTVIDQQAGTHRVTAVEETLSKTNLGHYQKRDTLNLERCIAANGRWDGHIVQGHVDQIAHCTQKEEREGSWIFQFTYQPSAQQALVEKGSICLNGTSLTCFNVTKDSFCVAIIPFTMEHTNFGLLQPGGTVNVEFDVIGKYVFAFLNQKK